MPTLEQRVATLEALLNKQKPQVDLAYRVAAALEGRQADATLSLPHNDSWLFEDNVDATHPANLRYIIAANTQRIVSARLSIHLAPYRTYNNVSGINSGNDSNGHTHAEAAHAHRMFAFSANIADQTAFSQWAPGSGTTAVFAQSSVGGSTMTTSNGNGAGTGGESATHTHALNLSAVLGVTEGATAAGVTVSFDGVDQTAALGGPFSVDQIELNVVPFLAKSPGVWHTIAMQPNGLGRIEAHLRLGVYVSAAQPI